MSDIQENRGDQSGKMTVVQAGAKGGRVTLSKYGQEHYARIGAVGGRKVAQDKEHMRRIGQRGGKQSGISRKNNA